MANGNETLRETLRLTQAELDALLEYSYSLPTGTTAGKRWKKRVGDEWKVGEYGDSFPDPRGGRFPARVSIKWYDVEVVVK